MAQCGLHLSGGHAGLPDAAGRGGGDGGLTAAWAGAVGARASDDGGGGVGRALGGGPTAARADGGGDGRVGTTDGVGFDATDGVGFASAVDAGVFCDGGAALPLAASAGFASDGCGDAAPVACGLVAFGCAPVAGAVAVCGDGRPLAPAGALVLAA
jgi:hypothetical protein